MFNSSDQDRTKCENGWRANIRDPLVERLLGPGKAFELASEQVAGAECKVFKGAPRNLAEIYRRVSGFESRLLVVQEDRQLTFGQGFARVAALARQLRNRFGVNRGDRVAIVTSNCIEWVISMLAVTSLGGVAALINTRGAAEEMLRAIGLARCGIAILDPDRDAIITEAESDPAWTRIVIGEPDFPLRPGRDADFSELSSPVAGERFEPDDMDSTAGAVILFTSGTTGFPKGALLSQGAIAHAVALSGFMGALQDIRYEEETGEQLPEGRRSMMTPLVILGPMFHVSGMLPVFRAVSLGTPIHIMTRWNADIAFDMIEQVGMTRLSFVPAMVWDMFRSPRATPGLLDHICYMMNGGAPLEPKVVAEIGKRMPRCLIANTYGQTELIGWITSISGDIYLDNPDSCGWACPSIEIRVRREDGSQADIGEPGELWVHSASVMNEYIDDPDATGAALQDGWLATGDVGTVDEGGLFRIVDRKKNLIISGGENIYCAEIERVIDDMVAVKEVIAYGLPDERLGERLAVTAVLAPEALLNEEDIKAYCRSRLAVYKVPRDVYLTDQVLPRTASGKIDRGSFLRGDRIHGSDKTDG